MKRLACMAATLVFSTTVLAAGELEINDSPLTLTLSDHNQARVSSCADFISLRKSGETVEGFPGLSDPDYHTAKDALFSCWLKAYTIDHGMRPVNTKKPSLSEVLKHFPATSSYISSDEELQNVEKNYANKTIAEYMPDLKMNDGRLESASNAAGYASGDYYAFEDKNGNELKIISFIGYAIGGTAENKVYYRIDDINHRIWKVTKLDENSPL